MVTPVLHRIWDMALTLTQTREDRSTADTSDGTHWSMSSVSHAMCVSIVESQQEIRQLGLTFLLAMPLVLVDYNLLRVRHVGE